jgi:hypothetical protein
MHLTSHAKQRMAERQIDLIGIKYAVCCGARYKSGCRTVCQIRHHQARRLGSRLRHLLGLTVVISAESTAVITTYWENLCKAQPSRNS